jgi:hypothetical protein
MKDSVTSSCLHTELCNVLFYIPCSSLHNIHIIIMEGMKNSFYDWVK